MLTPTAARSFWLALLENAARITLEAHTLFPSPRAQSLVVLAQEEIGKAVWVYKSFWRAWGNGDETPREIHELSQQGFHHLPKLIAATDFLTAMVDLPGWSGPVEIELARMHSPDVLDNYLKTLARDDNEAKKKGFYVDLQPDGSFTVPHEIDRPLLRFQIWETADMIQWFLTEDHFRSSVSGMTVPRSDEIEALLMDVLAHDPDN